MLSGWFLPKEKQGVAGSVWAGVLTAVACNAGQEGGVRAECLERYREKKRRRLYSKTIRYEKRKVNADNRRVS